MTEVQASIRGIRTDKWCLTLNNWTEEQYAVLVGLFPERIHFGVIGEERAPTTGTEHLQCFFHFKCRKDISAVRAIVQGHWSAAKGTCEQNLEYCSKGGEFRVLGVIQTPLATGRASQVQQDKLQVAIDGCATLEEFMTKHNSLYCRNCRGLQDIFALKYKQTAVKLPPTVIYLSGPTGCGKTRTAVELAKCIAPNQEPWFSGINLPWFDGYEGQKVAILDDVRKNTFPFANLLRILDRYPIYLPVKGVKGGTFWNPEYIFVTCPRLPSREFTFHDRYDGGNECVYEDVAQLARRCAVIIDVEMLGGQPVYSTVKGSQVWNDLLQKYSPLEDSDSVIVPILVDTQDHNE